MKMYSGVEVEVHAFLTSTLHGGVVSFTSQAVTPVEVFPAPIS
jgi:hypothetical protein